MQAVPGIGIGSFLQKVSPIKNDNVKSQYMNSINASENQKNKAAISRAVVKMGATCGEAPAEIW